MLSKMFNEIEILRYLNRGYSRYIKFSWYSSNIESLAAGIHQQSEAKAAISLAQLRVIKWSTRVNCHLLALHKFCFKEVREDDKVVLQEKKNCCNFSQFLLHSNVCYYTTFQQTDLNFTTTITMTRPPTLKSTVAITKTDWYLVKVQLLRNVKRDYGLMRNEFIKRTTT